MKSCISYVMSGAAHVPYLATSLLSLRRCYDGPIVVHAWPESFDLVRRVCNDPRIEADCEGRVPPYRGKNSQFLDKLRVVQMMREWDRVLYLDADTLVFANPLALLEKINKRGGCEFIATQFNDWCSNVGTPMNRVSRLVRREPIDQEAVNACLTAAYPSPNGGVFGARPGSQILALWEQWTSCVLDLFIADETVLHAIVAKFFGTQFMHVAIGGAWNCSPRYRPSSLPHDDIYIMHGHGDCFTRPEKSPLGYETWIREFRHALNIDVGGIRSWWQTCGNKHLNNCTDPVLHPIHLHHPE